MTGSSRVASDGLAIVFTSSFTGQVTTPDPVILYGSRTARLYGRSFALQYPRR